jgi:hypothetical protein
MISLSDFAIDPDAPDDDLDGPGDDAAEYLLSKLNCPKVLDRVRGNSCIGAEWNEYQNHLLADGRYTFEQLHPVKELCLFDAWDQAHKQDLVFEAGKRAAKHSTTKDGK